MKKALVLAGLMAALIVASFLARRGAPPPARQSAEPHRPAETRRAEADPPVQPKDDSPPAEAQRAKAGPIEPDKDVVKIFLRDIFGAAVPDAALRVNTGTGAEPVRTDAEGVAIKDIWVSPTGTNEAAVIVGQLHVRQPLVKGLNEIQLPSYEGTDYGEVAVLPAEWEKTAVRRRGSDHWMSPDAADPLLGRRFLFLRAGHYDISDGRDGVAGRVEVVAGERTTFVMKRVGALRIDVVFPADTKTLPASVPIELRGTTPRATHARAYRFFILSEDGRIAYTEYGLAPGTYSVYCHERQYRPFSSTVDVVEGEIAKLEVVLVRRE